MGGTGTITRVLFNGEEINFSSNQYFHMGESEQKKRSKRKGDPNQLRMKSKNKSTRPKWMDRA